VVPGCAGCGFDEVTTAFAGLPGVSACIVYGGAVSGETCVTSAECAETKGVGWFCGGPFYGVSYCSQGCPA
jgi:hypothetical protein